MVFTLFIYVKEGRDLPAMDKNGFSDPYCRILVAGQKPCKTAIIKKTLNPKWEPPAEAKFTLQELQGSVEIEVWDKDTLAKDDFMGIVVVKLPTAVVGKQHYDEAWQQLRPRDGQPPNVSGEILVGIKVLPEGLASPASVGLPTSYKDDVHDDVILSRLRQEISPVALFLAMPRVMLVMRRKAQEAKDRVQLRKSSESIGSFSEVDIRVTKPDEFRQLHDRLKALRLEQVESIGDGACQFRSISYQLYGTQDHHEKVRAFVVNHMRQNKESFSFYFDGDADYENYLKKMSMPRTWGDELTLKAACDAFGTEVHVITSTLDNWYLQYTPEMGDSDIKKKVFVCYISPLHYNSVEPVISS